MTAKGCRTELPRLVGQGVEGSAVTACREVAEEVTFDTGDMLVLDPMLSHSGSAFREGVTHRLGSSRYALFSLVADRAAIGTTLVALSQRNYTAPASKFPQQMRDALPAHLRKLVEWTLPFADDEPGLRSVTGSPNGAATAKL